MKTILGGLAKIGEYLLKWWTSSDRRETKVEKQKEANTTAVYEGNADAVNGRIQKLTKCVIVGGLAMLAGCTTEKAATVYVPSCMEAIPMWYDYQFVTVPDDPHAPAVTNTVKMQGWWLSNALMDRMLNELEEAKAAKKRD